MVSTGRHAVGPLLALVFVCAALGAVVGTMASMLDVRGAPPDRRAEQATDHPSAGPPGTGDC